MIKHIVFWKLKEEAHGKDRTENAIAIKTMLEDLNGKIAGLVKLEVGLDFVQSPDSAHVALYSEFESREALDFYQQHPLHKAVMPYIAEARDERFVVDYEI
ncbi:Dabb family protein [Pedobacter sp. HMF7647]|uniref:Dabb family protein n=1 Tax=Hufsiella arboris TaxID=2695275 RepID=A0A7K1YER0_9SPHI|nr:Dabb family protein [Hufsiella arboris]MXV52871.1 Dabb family protein [Hufsiella arboris]